MTKLTKSQRNTIYKVAGNESREPKIEIRDLDGVAVVTYWIKRGFAQVNLYRELVITPRGRLLNDSGWKGAS